MSPLRFLLRNLFKESMSRLIFMIRNTFKFPNIKKIIGHNLKKKSTATPMFRLE